MPLRTLLGYEPRAVRQREDFGAQFMTFAPVRAVMATNKQKYQAPMARVKKLAPIDEEGAGTPYPTPRQNVSIRRVPKSVFRKDDEFFPRSSSIKSKPMLPVQPIPRERVLSPPPLDDYVHAPKQDFHKQASLSPMNVNHTIVDGLVADYLHFSRYGHVIPVYEGTSVTTCPCCTDRNRQNVRTLLGFPKDIVIDTPAKYGQKSSIKHEKNEEKVSSSTDTSLYPNSLYAQMQRQKAQRHALTPEEKRLQQLANESRKQTWMNYQPLPYATNYLNPEFSRPSVMTSLLYDTDAHTTQRYMKHTVLEADTNYDTAMNKLSGYTYGSEKHS